jgi:hypothetical protein
MSELELFVVEFLPTPELKLPGMECLPTPALEVFVIKYPLTPESGILPVNCHNTNKQKI